MSKKPEITDKKIVFNSRVFSIEVLDLTFSNGETRCYERVKSRGHGAVLVVPLLDHDRFLLVREYAVGVDRYELGFVKGVIDAGETAEQAAQRELREEAGYGAKQCTVLKKISTSPGYMSSQLSVVLAQDLYEDKLLGDEPEPLEVIPWAWSDVDALLRKDEFSDARALTGLFMVREYLRSQT